jgi:hypothetical protein
MHAYLTFSAKAINCFSFNFEINGFGYILAGHTGHKKIFGTNYFRVHIIKNVNASSIKGAAIFGILGRGVLHQCPD